MSRVVFLLGLLLALAPGVRAEEPPPVRPPHAWHALNPSLSLAAPAATPLEQQVQQNYRTDLMQAQRELMLANPSGLGRAQIGIGHELNMYDTAPR